MEASVGYFNKLGKNLFVLPQSGKAKRDGNMTEVAAALDEALRTDPSLKCTGKIYADGFGWTNGTGVWVPEGSKRNHELYANASIAYPHLDHNGLLEKAGAKYLEHCLYLFHC